MPFVPGIDVSVYDPVVNWARVRQQGYRFAYIRASYGVSNSQTVMDTMFPSHWAGSKAAGLLRGPYHYLRAAESGTAQAEDFLEIVNLEKGDLPPALDLEEVLNQGVPNNLFITNAEAFLKKVKSETGITPMVYSRASFLKEKVSLPNGKAPAWAKDYKMWVAHWTYAYAENIKPDEMKGWSPYTFWQYSGERDFLDGITDEFGAPVAVDFDVFRGTLEELYALAGESAPSSTKYKVKRGDTLKNIADSFNLSLSELVDANPQILRRGMKLTIPQPPGASSTTPGTSPSPSAGPVHPTDTQPTAQPVVYKVKSGDTLSAIALRFGTTVKAIAEANSIPDPNLIFVDQELVIPQ